jgi:hypothetical protein
LTVNFPLGRLAVVCVGASWAVEGASQEASKHRATSAKVNLQCYSMGHWIDDATGRLTTRSNQPADRHLLACGHAKARRRAALSNCQYVCTYVPISSRTAPHCRAGPRRSESWPWSEDSFIFVSPDHWMCNPEPDTDEWRVFVEGKTTRNATGHVMTPRCRGTPLFYTFLRRYFAVRSSMGRYM